MTTKYIKRELPAPEVKDGSNSIMFMASQIATGMHNGATFDVDGFAFSFSATVVLPDGTRKREVLNIQNIINEWVTQMIDESAEGGE